MTTPAQRGPLHTFAWPIVFATIMVAGLVLGLLGTGWVDWVAVALLAGPTIFCIWTLRARPAGASEKVG